MSERWAVDMAAQWEGERTTGGRHGPIERAMWCAKPASISKIIARFDEFTLREGGWW